METQPSVLAWKISWAEEPGSLQSLGSQGVGHDQRDLTSTQPLLSLVSLQRTLRISPAEEPKKCEGKDTGLWIQQHTSSLGFANLPYGESRKQVMAVWEISFAELFSKISFVDCFG